MRPDKVETGIFEVQEGGRFFMYIITLYSTIVLQATLK